jgi:serine/threonine protein kinase
VEEAEVKEAGELETLVAELRATVSKQANELSELQKATRREKRKVGMEKSSLETELAEVKATLSSSEASVRNGRLAAKVYKLGSVLGRELEFRALVATAGFSEIVTAYCPQEGGEVIVKFSQGENMALLKRESDNLATLGSLDGAESHVVRLIEPYREIRVCLGAEHTIDAGAVIMEKGDWNLGAFVKAKLGQAAGNPKALEAAANAISKWEESIRFMHSHGFLHLDIKADNAVLFESGAVKLIDLAGMLSREHMSADSASLDSVDLSWDTADLEEMGVTYVSTITYRQPLDLGPGRRFLDYSADWWSLGVSKMEVLGAAPAVFANGEETTKLVYKSMANGELEDAIRSKMAAVLLEPDPSCAEVAVWVESVMQNLRGSTTTVEYVKRAVQEEAPKPKRKSRFAKVME